jgi:predicted acyl esterase
MLKRLVCALTICAAAALRAQQIELPQPLPGDPETLAPLMRVIAERAIAVTTDRENFFRLQLVAGHYDEALQSLPHSTINVRWEIYARAKQLESNGTPFDDAFRQSYRETMRALDDATAYRVLWSLGTSPDVLQNGLRGALQGSKGATSLPLPAAIDLVRAYLGADAYGRFAPLLGALTAEEDARRYVVEKERAVKMPDGATVCAIIVRPRAKGRRPALFNFTIYNDPKGKLDEARRAASNGYAGVIGLTRGKGCSPETPVTYEHDGADAAALIDWIAAQSWSDGRVGMYGGSYEGGTTWAAAKHMPKALKGMMTGAPVAPGIDVPMEGNVFWNFVYPFPFYTTNNKTLDNDTYNQRERWQRLELDWYRSGRAYRDLETIDGTPNPGFRKWIAHPSYDAYWRAMIPQGEEYGRVDIPVLTTAGYYFGGPGAAVHYFSEHTRHRSNAEHYLLIGPYDHVRGHGGTISVLGAKTTSSIAGYEIEPAAHIDMGELRYRWFDYVFGRGPKPEILGGKVNYEIMGANAWKHAPSLERMSSSRLRLDFPRTTLTVDLADRSDVDREIPGGNVIDRVIDTANAIKIVSDPIERPAEIAGLFSGRLEFITNKRDFDFQVTLYELTPSGEYVLLAPYWSRASYVGHPGTRRLLTPGKRQRLDFTAIRLIGRRVQPGSRIVAVIGVIKETGRQINYGSGKDVSAETIQDAGKPLRIEWLSRSHLDLPITRF